MTHNNHSTHLPKNKQTKMQRRKQIGREKENRQTSEKAREGEGEAKYQSHT